MENLLCALKQARNSFCHSTSPSLSSPPLFCPPCTAIQMAKTKQEQSSQRECALSTPYVYGLVDTIGGTTRKTVI